jgi:acyl CoA:acetate/3-ketoacid CoA transferase
MIAGEQVEAYNIDVLYAHRSRPAGPRADHRRLILDPRRQGGKMNDATRRPRAGGRFDGQEWLYMRSIPVDVAIIMRDV